MKLSRTIKSLGLGFLLLGLMIASSPSKASDTSVKIATGEWPPFISEAYPHYGIVSQIIRESFARGNITAHFSFFPWSRAELMVQKGEWHALSIQGKTEERQRDYLYSDVVLEGQLVFFHMKDEELRWETIDDLSPFVMAGTLSYDYGKKIQEAEASGKLKVHRVADDLTAFRLLLSGRVDLVPANIINGYHLMNNIVTDKGGHFYGRDISALNHAANPIRTSYYYLTFDKKKTQVPHLLESFNRGLAYIKASGRYDALLQETTNALKNVNTK